MQLDDRLYQFSVCSMSSGRYEAARDGFRALLLLENTNPIYWLGLSEASWYMHDREQAENALKIGRSLYEKKAEGPFAPQIRQILESIEAKVRET